MRIRPLLLALLLSACASPPREPMPKLTPRRLADLPTTTLPWLSLRDHFVATVGPQAGQGRPLGPLLVLAAAALYGFSTAPMSIVPTKRGWPRRS